MKDGFLVFAALSAIVSGVFWLEDTKAGRKIFKILPALVWVYFLPMLFTTAGILPQRSPVYASFKDYLLPGALLLLLATSDLRSIGKAGLPAIVMFFFGSAGIIAGGVVSITLFGPVLPSEAWKGFGALAGSWIGGSANMVGLSEVFQTPPGLFGQMVIVDTVVGYAWIGILISLSQKQRAIDGMVGARMHLLEEAKERIEAEKVERGKPLGLKEATLAIGIAASGAAVCMKLGSLVPEIENIVNPFAWGIFFVSLLGIALSFTPVRRLKDHGIDKLGYAGIYLMLAGVGAKADLLSIGKAPELVMAGVLWISIHLVFLVGGMILLKAPFFFLAVGSTANIGGPASAPLVASVYRPELTPIGLLLAVLGNTAGYYLGFVTGVLCRYFSGG